jgi:hypothetical protein
MHRLGTVLAASYHEDELRRAETMRRVQPKPDLARAVKAESKTGSKPSLRERLAAAFHAVPTRPADV